MWVVFCLQSGEEQDTFSTLADANSCALNLELHNTWNETFDVRWERD